MMKTNYIVVFLLFCLGLYSQNFVNFYKEILLSSNIIILIVTLIAGLFGFIIAVIPFAIQSFNQIYTNKKLLDEFEMFAVPMLKRFIETLRIMLSFFIFLVCIYTIKEIKFIKLLVNMENIKNILIILLFIIYISFFYKLYHSLNIIIKDLDTMINIFTKKKIKELKKDD